MEFTRKDFLGFGGTAMLFAAAGCRTTGTGDKPTVDGKVIAGFDETVVGKLDPTPWKPFSDKKVRVGIAGHGICQFGCCFGYQNHPNVEVVACTDLDPKRCDDMAKRLVASSDGRLAAVKQFKSCEEMIKGMRGKMDAVYIATDPPSHAPLAILAMENGMHAVSAVPAFWGDIQEEYAQKLIDTVKKTGMTYQMNETTAFRPQCFAMRALYEAGALGKVIYTEGEYWHHGTGAMGGYGGWRNFAPSQWYCTHSNGFYNCVTHGAFAKCSCLGVRTHYEKKLAKIGLPGNFGNVFGTEVALLKTVDGGMARMGRGGDTPGALQETGRCLGTRGLYNEGYKGEVKGEELDKIACYKPQLPPGVPAGGHGGSHGYLTDDFIRSILLGKKPIVDVYCAVNMTIPGIYMHRSAVKDGEWMTIPQFKA